MENEGITKQEKIEVSSGNSTLTKGDRLRQAREEKSLSYDDVVGQLNFEKRFLIALENDEHDIFPGRAYLYGYMRAYTRLLDLPVEEFVENLQFKSESHEEVVHEVIDTQLESNKHTKIWYVLAAVIALVVVLLVIQNANESEPVVESNLIEPDEIESKDSMITPEQNYLDNIQDEVTKEPGPQTKIPAVMTGDRVVSTITSNDVMPTIENQVEAKLELNYTDASWTDIRDGAGQRLVYRMVERGSELELNASPPFKILLGYSPGVTVKYNDRLFDHSGFEKENIAYFTLDNNASSKTKVITGENIKQEIVSAQQHDTNQIEIGRDNTVFELFSE